MVHTQGMGAERKLGSTPSLKVCEMASQIKERAFDLLQDMIEGRAVGDHKFTGGARLAWRRQKRLALRFLRAIITDASFEFTTSASRAFAIAVCPQVKARNLGRYNERGTKAGAKWVMDIITLRSNYIDGDR